MLAFLPSLVLTAFFSIDANGDMMGVSASHTVEIAYAPAEVEAVIDHRVPFTSQAPFANWDDPRKRDGCEEASVIMAARWANDLPLTADQANASIDGLSAFSEQRFGSYIDQSIEDTATMLREYADVAGGVYYDVGADEMIRELRNGSILIIPVDGTKLENPYFLDPPPARHMLVVRGYDFATREFITNEPGTRRGDGYRYGRDLLAGAIRDYPTGNHLPVTGHTTAMLVVTKN